MRTVASGTVKAVERLKINLFPPADHYLSDNPLSFIINPESGIQIYNAKDAALIPIGGTPELTSGYSHLPPHEATLAAHCIGANIVMPTHYQPDAENATAFTTTLSPTWLHPSASIS